MYAAARRFGKYSAIAHMQACCASTHYHPDTQHAAGTLYAPQRTIMFHTTLFYTLNADVDNLLSDLD